MYEINTVERLAKYFSALDNVEMRLDDDESSIYLNHSVIAKGVLLKDDEMPNEKLVSLKENNNLSGVDIFVYTDTQIFFDGDRELDSPFVKNSYLGEIESFIRHLFEKYPDMQPVEFRLETKGNEMYQLTNNLNKTISQLRLEKSIYKEEIFKLENDIEKLSDENEKIEKELDKLYIKNNLLSNSIKYLYSKYPFISQNQYDSLKKYVNQQSDALLNKIISIYDNSFVSITFNSLVNAGNDLFGSPVKQESPRKTCIIFNTEGEISNNNNNLSITFQIDWDTFLDLKVV